MRSIHSFPAILLRVGACACAALLGCSDSDSPAAPPTSTETPDGGGPEDAPPPPPGTLAVTPAEAKIGALRPQAFTAQGDVTWSVTEPDGGYVDEAGKYIAPEKPGVYHVVATSKADAAVKGTATVTVVPLIVKLLAGTPGGPGSVDGLATEARFRDPAGVAALSNPERLIIADRSNHTIRAWDAATNTVKTVAGTAGEPGSEDGIGPAARFNYPEHVAVDPTAKTAWVADYLRRCIRQVALDTGAVTTLAGNCNESGAYVDGATGPETRFTQIYGMVLGPENEALYVCEYNYQAFVGVRRVEVGGATPGKTTSVFAQPNKSPCRIAVDGTTKHVYFTQFNGSWETRYFDDKVGGPGVNPGTVGVTTAGTSAPFGVVGADLYMQNSSYLRRWIAPGPWTNYTSTAGAGAVVDGPVANARFGGILGVAASRTDVYVSDSYDVVRKIDVGAGMVSTLLGATTNIVSVDGAPGTGRIPSPIATAADDAGNLYVLELGNGSNAIDNVIRKVDAATQAVGAFSGLASKAPNHPTSGGGANGDKDNATFGRPYDVVRLGGDLYVTDVAASAVRKVSLATGAVETPFGKLNVKDFADGVGEGAFFNFRDVPFYDVGGYGGGITTDGTDLYVCDTGNSRIRKLTVATGAVTTIAGDGEKATKDGIGTAAKFYHPSGIAYYDGFLYVADAVANVIRRIDLKTNEVTTWAGLAYHAGYQDGSARTATFTLPFRLVSDGLGSLYLTEAPPEGNQTPFSRGGVIRRLDVRTETVSTFAGSRNRQGLTFVDLPASLNCPAGLSFDKDGNLIVTDYCDGAIAALVPHL